MAKIAKPVISIPSTLRKKMEQILHTRNLFVERTKLNAKSAMYWPNLDKEKDKRIINCE